jgi:anaerobic ribonucleoside-triphosphate reductase activating protein
VDEVFSQVVAAQAGFGVEGLTVSGGEPMQQRHSLLPLLRRVRAETDLSVLVFSGYTWDEIGRMRGAASLLATIDVLIAGRYDQCSHLARGLRGSANKTVHLLTPRYRMEDIDDVPRTEIVIEENGDVIVTGIDPLRAWHADEE